MRSRFSTVTFLAALGVTVACSSASSRGSFDEGTSNDTATPAATDDTVPPPPAATGTPAPPPATTGTPPPPPPADGGSCKTTAPSNKCGLVPQCGCTATETCDVQDASGDVACVTAGTAAMGKPCTSTAGCAVGLTCVFGTCHAFCDAPGSACSGASSGTGSCIAVQNGSGAAIPSFDVCLVKCDLRDANACGGTTAAGTGACVVDSGGNTDCQAAPGTHKVNETCTPSDDCGPGLVCVGPSGGTSSCKAWCRVGTTDCGAGKTCTGFQTKLVVDGVEYGACP